MSYIRSGGNPDKLYVWSNGTEVHVAVGGGNYFSILESDFNRLIIRSYNNGLDSVEYRGIRIDCDEVMGKSILYYTEHRIEMWDATWGYVVCSRILHWKRLNKIASKEKCNKYQSGGV